MIGERIREQRKEAGLTQEQLGKLIGVTKATISQWESGQTSPNGTNLTALSRILKCPSEWLVNGGEKSDDVYIHSSKFKGRLSQGEIRIAGVALMSDDGIIDYISELSGVLNFYSPDKEAYAVKIKGDTLWPRINNGEFIIVSPGTTLKPGDEVFIETKQGKQLIKKLAFLRDSTYQFNSINQSSAPISMDVSEVSSVHAISAILKEEYFEEK